MKQGTVSWFVGCHSIIHSVLVVRAWHYLYGRWPQPWELCCIAIHDIGHIGKQYLDDIEQKNDHWKLGARIARKLFGERGYLLVAGHCRPSGLSESKLYKPDKYSWMYEPYWWAWWNAKMEPKLKMNFQTIRDAYDWFHKSVRQSIESGEYRPTHEFYIEGAKK